MNILLLEGNELTRRRIAKTLGKKGYGVTCCEDEPAAFTALENDSAKGTTFGIVIIGGRDPDSLEGIRNRSFTHTVRKYFPKLHVLGFGEGPDPGPFWWDLAKDPQFHYLKPARNPSDNRWLHTVLRRITEPQHLAA